MVGITWVVGFGTYGYGYGDVVGFGVGAYGVGGGAIGFVVITGGTGG